MKKIIFLLLFTFLMSCSSKKFVHPTDNCSDCHSMLLPMYIYKQAQGQWLEQEDGHYWYRHTDKEYDTIDCQSCHPEMSPTVWACSQEGQSCQIISNNGTLNIECEDVK